MQPQLYNPGMAAARALVQIMCILATGYPSLANHDAVSRMTSLPVIGSSNISSKQPLNVPQYRFQYYIRDERTGDFQSQEETRNGETVHGSYTVADPNGDLRTVTYMADMGNGFHAVVNMQPGSSPQENEANTPKQKSLGTEEQNQNYFNTPIPRNPESSPGVSFGIPIVKAHEYATGTTISIPTTVIQSSEMNKEAAILVEVQLSNMSNTSFSPSSQQHSDRMENSRQTEASEIVFGSSSVTEPKHLAMDNIPSLQSPTISQRENRETDTVHFESLSKDSVILSSTQGTHRNGFKSMTTNEPPSMISSSELSESTPSNVPSPNSYQPNINKHLQQIWSNVPNNTQKLQDKEPSLKSISQDANGQQSMNNVSKGYENTEKQEPESIYSSFLPEKVVANSNKPDMQLATQSRDEAALRSFSITPESLRAIGIDPETIEFGPGSIPMAERLASDRSRLKLVHSAPQHTTHIISPSEAYEHFRSHPRSLMQGGDSKPTSGQGLHDSTHAYVLMSPSTTVLVQDAFQAQLSPTSLRVRATPGTSIRHTGSPHGKSLLFTDTMQPSEQAKIRPLLQNMFPGISDTSILQQYYTYPIESFLRYPAQYTPTQHGYSEHRRYFPHILPYSPPLALLRTIVMPVAETHNEHGK